MTNIWETAATIAQIIWRASWQGAILIGIVLVLRAILGRRVTPAMWCAVWMLVGLRLVLPGVGVTVWEKQGDVATVQPHDPAPAATATLVVTKGSLTGIGPEAVVATPIPAVAAPSGVSTGKVLIGAWCAGVLAMVLRRMACEIRLARKINRMARSQDDRAIRIVRECATTMRVRRAIEVVETDEVRSPALWGWRRAVLILPAGFAREASDEDLKLVVMHELAHVRRWDLLADRVMGFVRDLHWFNPMAWAWLAMYRRDRELACDEAVLRNAQPNERQAYGQCLLRLVERISGLKHEPAAIGMFDWNRSLEARIERIGQHRPRRGAAMIGTLLIAVIGAAAVVDARAEEKTEVRTTVKIPEGGTPLVNGKPEPGIKEIPLVERRAGEETASRTADAKNAETQKLLEKSLPEARFDAIPFSDVIDFLRDVSSANIFVNWRELEAAGIDRQAPVTTRLREVSLAKTLDVILRDVGGGTIKLGYTVDEGIITISTDEDLSKNVITRVYDVRDLIVEPTEAWSDHRSAPKRGQSGGAATAEPDKRAERVQSLVQLIQETVAPDSWRDAGGTVGSVRELQGQLIVTQTPENHKELVALLAMIRKEGAVQVSLQIRFVEIDASRLGREGAEEMIVNDERATAILQAAGDVAPQSNRKGPMRVTLFNSQSGTLKLGTETPYVSGIVVVKKGAETRYEPQTSTVDLGTLMEVTPTVSADRRSVTLSMHPRVTELKSLDSVKWEGVESNDEKLRVQKPLLDVLETWTTASVPAGATIVLNLGAKSADEGKRVIVLVKPTVMVDREVVEAEFPLQATPLRAAR